MSAKLNYTIAVFNARLTDLETPPSTTPPAAVNCVWSDWSEWSSWSSWTSNGNGTESRTRTRARTHAVEASNGGTACVGDYIDIDTETRQETEPGSPTGTLSVDDLIYQGFFLVPDDTEGNRLAWSAGALAVRKVGSEIRLFLAASAISPSLGEDEINEITYPGSVGQTLGTAPRATLVRHWGNIYDGHRLPSDVRTETRGLLWHDDKLWWAYGRYYNVASVHDPSIGCTVLDDDLGTFESYGPWRTSVHSQKTRGYMVEIPSAFADANTSGNQIGVGSPPVSGNVTSPMGSWLSVLPAFNPLTTPQDTTSTQHVTLTTDELLAHDLANPQSRPDGSAYKACHLGVSSTDPTFRNAVGEGFLAYDMICSAAWVKTETREGLVMVGQIADVIPGMTYNVDTVPHMWYGPYQNAAPYSVCSHGQRSTIGVGTGPKCGSMVPYVWVYAPETLAAVANGTIGAAAAMESSSAQLEPLATGITSPVLNDYTFGGMAFEPESGLLFLTEVAADTLTNSFEPRPIIHVFTIT